MSRRTITTKHYPSVEEVLPVKLYAQFNEDLYDGYKVIKLENGHYLTVPQRRFPPVTKEDIAKFEYALADESIEGDERLDVLEEIVGRLLYHIRKTNGHGA